MWNKPWTTHKPINITLLLVTCMYVCMKNLLSLVVVDMAHVVQILYSHAIKHMCL